MHPLEELVRSKQYAPKKQLMEATVQGIERLKAKIEEPYASLYPSVDTDPMADDHGHVVPAADHGNVVPEQSDQPAAADMPRRGYGCTTCNANLRALSPKHTRKAGRCKFPSLEPQPYKCPTCVESEDRYMNPREKQKGHTRKEGECRFASTPSQTRTGHHPRDPRVPAREHPSSEASGHDAAIRSSSDHPAAASSDEQASAAASPEEPVEDTGEASSSSRQGRDPDTVQRVRRTFADRGQGGERLPDLSRFNIQVSLKNLRSWNPKVVQDEIRKLHLRWWHASEPKM